MTTTVQEIRVGHSPDPDDAFMFYGFASGAVAVPTREIKHVLHDIQTLNEIAHGNDPLEVTAMSAHAYLELEDRYELLEVGTSVGRSYGPRLVARTPVTVAALRGKTIALPGPKTTATLVARNLLPPFKEVHLDFTTIMDSVIAGEVDAGLLIHEGQLTYRDLGLHLVTDLGMLFHKRHGLPLPLGVNCVRRDLDTELKRAIATAYRRSVEYALANRVQAVEYSRAFGRGLDVQRTDLFVGMYVNEDSLAFSQEIRQAMAVLAQYYRSTECEPTGVSDYA